MTFQEYKKMMEAQYPVNRVPVGVQWWTRKLLQQCFGVFDYTGLPDSLAAEELEKRILTGFGAVFQHPTFGLVTAFGSLYGVNEYDHATSFIYAQPVLGSGTLTIGKDVAIIYNDSSDMTSGHPAGLMELIRRYARLLADIDSSINILTVNARQSSWDVAKSDAVAKSIEAARTKMRAGEYGTISDVGLFENFHTFPAVAANAVSMSDLLNARDALIRSFLSELGIKNAARKAERMLTDEVAADDDLLLANVQDMLEARQKGVDQVNRLFGTNISVRLGHRSMIEPAEASESPMNENQDEKEEPNDDEQ